MKADLCYNVDVSESARTKSKASTCPDDVLACMYGAIINVSLCRGHEDLRNALEKN